MISRSPTRRCRTQLDGLFIDNGIHPFLSDVELDSRLTADRRIEASLHRVAPIGPPVFASHGSPW